MITMDTVNIISTLVSNIGFPIIACGYMYKMNREQAKQHKEESDALSKALDNNTLIITQLKVEIETRWGLSEKEDK